jgi:hypothetical protein
MSGSYRGLQLDTPPRTDRLSRGLQAWAGAARAADPIVHSQLKANCSVTLSRVSGRGLHARLLSYPVCSDDASVQRSLYNQALINSMIIERSVC